VISKGRRSQRGNAVLMSCVEHSVEDIQCWIGSRVPGLVWARRTSLVVDELECLWAVFNALQDPRLQSDCSDITTSAPDRQAANGVEMGYDRESYSAVDGRMHMLIRSGNASFW